MSEAKGPYRKITQYRKFETDEKHIDVFGDGVPEIDFQDRDGFGFLRAINLAYANGRASRDGLRKAAKDVMSAMDARKNSSLHEFFEKANPALESLSEALEADGGVK